MHRIRANPDQRSETRETLALARGIVIAAAKPIALFSWVIGLFLTTIGMMGHSDNESQNWIEVSGSILSSSIEKKIINRSLSTFTSRHSVSYNYEHKPYTSIIDWGSEETRSLMEQKLSEFLTNWNGSMFISKVDHSEVRLSLEDQFAFRNFTISGFSLLIFAVIVTTFLFKARKNTRPINP